MKRERGLRGKAVYQQTLWDTVLLTPRETQTAIGEFFEQLLCVLLKRQGAVHCSIGNSGAAGSNWDVRLAHGAGFIESKAAGTGRACWGWATVQADALRAAADAGQHIYGAFWRYKTGRRVTAENKLLGRLYTVLAESVERLVLVDCRHLVELLETGKKYQYGRNTYVEVKQAAVLQLFGDAALPVVRSGLRVGQLRVQPFEIMDLTGLL